MASIQTEIRLYTACTYVGTDIILGRIGSQPIIWEQRSAYNPTDTGQELHMEHRNKDKISVTMGWMCPVKFFRNS